MADKDKHEHKGERSHAHEHGHEHDHEDSRRYELMNAVTATLSRTPRRRRTSTTMII
jgi:hypothetical protein